RSCCCQVGPVPWPGKKPRGGELVPAGPLVPEDPRGLKPKGPKLKPNSIISGTEPLALAGTVMVNWMSTLMAGYEELSTWPKSSFVTTAKSTLFVLVV